jgi:Stress responsive A/B Barrel Domain
MHSHNVFFWLEEKLSNSALLEFEVGLNTLIKTPLVLSGYFGKPANTNRTVVDNTYSYGLTLLFNDTADHNLYQADPIHLAFVDKNSKKWTKVLVYDIELNKT